MTANELGMKLNAMYSMEKVNKTTMVHLFGVIYADIMRKENIKPIEVVKIAGISENYQTEISKGMRLAEYVTLKDEYKSVFN